MGKTRDRFKKIRDTKGTFHAKMGSIKDRNGMDLTETKLTLTISSSNCAPQCLPKRVENSCPHKSLHKIFIAARVIIAETWKQPRRPSTGERIDRGNPDSGILFSAKKK